MDTGMTLWGMRATPLHIACSVSDPTSGGRELKLVQMLVQARANVNAPNHVRNFATTCSLSFAHWFSSLFNLPIIHYFFIFCLRCTKVCDSVVWQAPPWTRWACCNICLAANIAKWFFSCSSRRGHCILLPNTLDRE